MATLALPRMVLSWRYLPARGHVVRGRKRSNGGRSGESKASRKNCCRCKTKRQRKEKGCVCALDQVENPPPVRSMSGDQVRRVVATRKIPLSLSTPPPPRTRRLVEETRRAPSRCCRDTRVRGNTTTVGSAMHDTSAPPRKLHCGHAWHEHTPQPRPCFCIDRAQTRKVSSRRATLAEPGKPYA